MIQNVNSVCPKTHPLHIIAYCFWKFRLNVIVSSMDIFSMCFSTVKFCDWKSIYVPGFSNSYYMLRPARLSRLVLTSNTSWKVFFVQFKDPSLRASRLPRRFEILRSHKERDVVLLVASATRNGAHWFWEHEFQSCWGVDEYWHSLRVLCFQW
jgi:hypothetical protein